MMTGRAQILMYFISLGGDVLTFSAPKQPPMDSVEPTIFAFPTKS